jgi:glucose-6-phosphate dehydrogenase assembly protein OpcA
VGEVGDGDRAELAPAVVAVAVPAAVIYAWWMVRTEPEAAALAALEEVLAGMGSDVCIWSVSLAIDEIAADLGADTTEQEHLRALLRTGFGLAV